MRAGMTLRHEFVEYVPDLLADGIIYVSIPLATAVHKCCCGCGSQVVTPISRTDWELSFDGESVSLEPSIGNWSYPCQSHYWIKRNRVQWAPRWSRQQIDAGRAHDHTAKGRYYGTDPSCSPTPRDAGAVQSAPSKPSLWARAMRWFS